VDRRHQQQPRDRRLKVQRPQRHRPTGHLGTRDGPAPPVRQVLACPDEPACVRVEHLRRDPPDSGGPKARATSSRGRGRRGGGSLQHVRSCACVNSSELVRLAVGFLACDRVGVNAAIQFEATSQMGILTDPFVGVPRRAACGGHPLRWHGGRE
jgi:hypothetical protein